MKNNKSKFLIFAMLSVAIIFSMLLVSAAQLPVNLGTSGDFVILSKTGISTTGTTSVTGDIGVSPIDSTAITGFGLIGDVTTDTFLTSALVTGKIYSADLVPPTPTKMTTAISDMETAFTDAQGRTHTTIITDLGAGDISGMTLTPGVSDGLYKWSTGLLINSDVTLSGSADDVFIFQIAGNLAMGPGAKIILNGVQADNVFWAVNGGVGVSIDTTAHIEGNILASKAIIFNTGSTINGRALSQTAVTLDANAVTLPAAVIITPPVTTTGSSGGGSYCSTKWECTEWSECIDDKQTRECSYRENWCKPEKVKPTTSQTCITVNVDSKPVVEPIVELDKDGTPIETGATPITGEVTGDGKTTAKKVGIIALIGLLAVGLVVFLVKLFAGKK